MARKIRLSLVAALLVFGLCSPAQAVLNAVGPTDPVNGYPQWYQDSNGIALSLCLDGDGLNGLCLFDAPVAGNAFSQTVGFGDEAFFWIADSVIDMNGDNQAVLVLALEAAYGSGPPLNGDQFVFGRVRIRIDTPVAGTYRVIHPYGVEVFQNVAAGRRAINMTRDIGGITPDLGRALTGDVGPFLVAVNPPPPPGYIGDPQISQTVTGSPYGTNYFRIEGPAGSNLDGNGNDFIQSNEFTVAGKLYTGETPTPLVLNRSSYSRTVPGQVDVFATSPATSLVNVNASGSVPATTMAGDGMGRFFGHVDLTDASTLPATISVTADNSITNPFNTPVTVVGTLVDEVTITKAEYDVISGILTVAAESSDKAVPVPALTAAGLGALAEGALTASLAIPPGSVTVTSTAGGSDTEPVKITRGTGEPSPPSAVNDFVTTIENAEVRINVVANDFALAPGEAIDAATVAVVELPAYGSVLNNGDGTVSYTPSLDFSGIDSFIYAVQDTAGTASNLGFVIIEVEPLNVLPVAVNDTAVTNKNAAILNKSLVANDFDADGTINAATVAIVGGSGPFHGVLTNNGNGTVNYTPALDYTGLDTFAYNVKDNLGATSNNATVIITVNAAPTAVNDTAVTATNTPVTINVTLNDVDTDGAVNPATVAIVANPARGTLVNNLDGTVRYTPAVGFGGTDTFTYRVADNNGALSNAAAVSVGVETLTITRAEYISGTRTWRIQGKSTARAGNSVTINVGNSLTGTVVGTARVGSLGNWSYSKSNSLVAPDITNTISIKSAIGASIVGAPLTIK